MFGLAPAGDDRPHPFNHDRNAVWLEHRWLEREQPTAGDGGALLRRSASRGVVYVFPHLIPFNCGGPPARAQPRPDAGLPRGGPPRGARHQGAALGGRAPGGLSAASARAPSTSATSASASASWPSAAASIDEGFDGIHLNIEPVDDGNDDFLALLRALRTAVGPGRGSSPSPPSAPRRSRFPWRPNFVWTPDYYRRVAAVADQIVVMAYDTALPTAVLYRRYVAYAARRGHARPS